MVTHCFADKDEVVLEVLLVDASRQLRFETALAQDSSLVDAGARSRMLCSTPRSS